MVPLIDLTQSPFTIEFLRKKLFDNSKQLSILEKKIDADISLIKRKIELLEMHLSRDFQYIKNFFLQVRIDKIESKMQIKQLQIQNILNLRKIEALYKSFLDLSKVVDSLKTHQHEFNYIVVCPNYVGTRSGTTFTPKL